MKIYRKLFPYLKPHLGLLGVSCLFMLASTLFKGVSLWTLVPLIDTVLLNHPIHLPAWLPATLALWAEKLQAMPALPKLHLVVALIITLFVLKNLCLFAQSCLMSDVALRFLRDIRNSLYRHYQRLSLDFFNSKRTGELVSRMTFDVAVLHNALTEGVTDAVFQVSQVFLFAATVLLIDWKLALVSLAILPFIVYPIVQIGRVLRKLGLVVQERMADINSRLIETLQGIRIIKAFTAEKLQEEQFRLTNQEYYKANIRTVKRSEALGVITELIGMFGVLIVLEIGGRQVLNHQLSPGTFVLFLASLFSLYQPFKRLGRLHALNQQAQTAAGRVVDIFETRPSIRQDPNPIVLTGFKRQIEFQNVSFRYEEKPVVREVNLAVPAGEVVAIVGPSGSGKTTLVNLIPRFYDPSGGRILIDGVDLKKVGLTSLRRQIGLVTQESFLFHDTIFANIAFGKPQATLEEVARAAGAANADGFIRSMPKGYDTSIGDLGAKLSGGERQRLSIARAILKDPPILILDEATSQLDSESEALVQEALERLMEGRTVFVIAHRLSTIRKVDRIIVLNEGRIAQTGRHEELLPGSPIYRRLYELQVT